MKLQRMCCVCREMKGKSEFFKVVRTADEIKLDPTGKLEGRGAYVCKSEECLKKARKIRAFERSFSTRIDQELYDSLEALKVNE